MTPKTPTPETDAFKRTVGTAWHHFAEKLERERDAARAEIDAMREVLKEAHKIIEVLYMDALDNHKESWPRANEWLQKHAAFANLQPPTPGA